MALLLKRAGWCPALPCREYGLGQTKPIPVRLTGWRFSTLQVQKVVPVMGSTTPQSSVKSPSSGNVIEGEPIAVLMATPLRAMQRAELLGSPSLARTGWTIRVAYEVAA